MNKNGLWPSASICMSIISPLERVRGMYFLIFGKGMMDMSSKKRAIEREKEGQR